jgi:hypothetical protein
MDCRVCTSSTGQIEIVELLVDKVDQSSWNAELCCMSFRSR